MLGVAVALRVPLVPHAVAIQRAQDAVARIDVALAAAKRRGALSFLIPVQRDDRLAARAAGKHFPRYALVFDKQLRAEAFNQVRIPPTAIEVGNMETAIVWPARYLAARPLIMRAVHRVAAGRARGQAMDLMAQRMKRRAATVRAMNRAGLDLIADGLRRDGVAVF